MSSVFVLCNLLQKWVCYACPKFWKFLPECTVRFGVSRSLHIAMDSARARASVCACVRVLIGRLHEFRDCTPNPNLNVLGVFFFSFLRFSTGPMVKVRGKNSKTKSSRLTCAKMSVTIEIGSKPEWGPCAYVIVYEKLLASQSLCG